MERKDVQIILKRIKTNYNDFILDDYTTSEWYKELKDYDLEDVMEKLELHFRSEEYGNVPPKMYFLTKYLKKTKDKFKEIKYNTTCPICKKIISNDNFEKHYDKCSSIDYIVRNRKRHYNKETDVKSLWELNDDEFYQRYWKFCETLIDNPKLSDMERIALKNAILTHYGYEVDSKQEFEKMLGGK